MMTFFRLLASLLLRGGLAIVAIAAKLFLLRMQGFFLKDCMAFEAFLKISILFEDIFRETEAFFN
jgi:hypothetical protein